MPRQKFEFANAEGQTLAGLLETPLSGRPEDWRYAVFAHCFTCGKDIAAATRISRGLAARGIAVLRFDFTGLGGSDGDFANTDFSSNVADLLAAAQALEAHHSAPSLLVGHSLGGAAVLVAAQSLPGVKAVATIGAPATADHVKHLFADVEERLHRDGEASVTLGPRRFNIRRQLLDDLDAHASAGHIRRLGRPLLVFHSPLDEVVPIEQAARIYEAALHPKSFISLDRADHLLSRQEDAEYVSATLAAWAGRYLGLMAPPTRPAGTVEEGEVLVTELDKHFLRGLYSASHALLADEPLGMGGGNRGPTPYDLLLMSLGACTSMTLRMYADRKRIPLEDVDIELVHERVHARDCAECAERDGHVERITRRVRLVGDLDAAQREDLLRIADRCPVHRTLASAPVIVTHLVD
ncbi:bifunctional alpha/beta hydrolase/OsmC family protein [Marilutibacter aestuarii]|uniref:OsmC family protein n=1 Tax=Marilutibacter aestuarii TaxID=1706195 RepID=A0A508AN38_9GAMM|nr:bifunctional alpha/beta hydrolase/OsmC family protein [Lysobacter aestuarii]TQD51570.1 OsmC family protein [Lysobacter aestuarii]